MPIDYRPTREDPDNDNWGWLQEIEAVGVLDWVRRQNSETFRLFADSVFEADRDALAAIMDRPDRIPFVRRRGAHLYNFWQDAENPRGLWRRTSLASFQTSAPEWEVLLDLDALAAKEGEDWVWKGAATSSRHSKAVLSLSRGGGDAVALREFDLSAGAFVANGFELPEAKGGAEWLDEDALLLTSAYGDGMATRAGYARTVRCWRRGAPIADAAVLFETSSDMGVYVDVDHTASDRRIWYVDWLGFFDFAIWLGDETGPQQKLELPTDAETEIFGDWIAVRPRSACRIGDIDCEAGALVGGSLSALVAGAPAFTRLFTPTPRCALEAFSWAGERLVLAILDELRPRFELRLPRADEWAAVELPGGPAFGVADMWRLDSDAEASDGALLINSQDPITPATLSMLDASAPELAAPTVLKQAPAVFDAGGLVVSRHEAISSDGERIPYTMTGPAAASGDAPVYLTGYGGFEASVLPHYSALVGKAWLERGGVSVTAHIRGGGEFGPEWHVAGMRERKRLSHDDFASVAADLVARGVTVPQRIAAEGGSNGGLLIANMLTRFPERFGALFCTVPLVDMRRYHKLLAGSSWIAEYGDPEKPEDWAFMQHFSAYHCIEPDRAYPPILIATTRRDDRVHPGHARKFAAKLQALGYDAHYHELDAGGHSYGKDSKEKAAFSALGFRFLRQKIGWA
ncbi:MAG: prolyl oligopeptidase family serine peptidase [Neomegalonema sp.]|nr:prolyl oligopeptidase family serine peptidase [Neomegalonema sp.]